MTVRIVRVLAFAEFCRMQDEARGRGWYSNDRRMFLPGTAWTQPFLYDPTGEFAAYKAAHPGRPHMRPRPMYDEPPPDPHVRGYLSPHYWRDHARARPPICVVCPNGSWWGIDQWSNNGTGWTVTGEPPAITCAPSIVAADYHGFLRAGEFTADIEGRAYAPVV